MHRTWRQWARRNDCKYECCVEKKNCAGAILCVPYTCVKWLTVGVFTIPLFLAHLLSGLSRFFAGGAFHMVCRACCHDKNNACLTVSYYVFGGPVQVINFIMAGGEMFVILIILSAAFFFAFFSSAFNPFCAVETCIELIVISDGIYRHIFSNLPVALEHPGKLISPCSFGFAYKSGDEVVYPQDVEPAQLAESGLQMQPYNGAVQPSNVAQPMYMAHAPIVQGIPEGLPMAGALGSSHDSNQIDSYTSGKGVLA
uniref:Uncharacterized protein n=1 Tax=Octactis speculum TaxID=3111310 RepID=A0A7S2F351_9STRA